MATGGGVYIQLSLNSPLTLYYSYQIGAILVISNTRISPVLISTSCERRKGISTRERRTRRNKKQNKTKKSLAVPLSTGPGDEGEARGSQSTKNVAGGL